MNRHRELYEQELDFLRRLLREEGISGTTALLAIACREWAEAEEDAPDLERAANAFDAFTY